MHSQVRTPPAVSHSMALLTRSAGWIWQSTNKASVIPSPWSQAMARVSGERVAVHRSWSWSRFSRTAWAICAAQGAGTRPRRAILGCCSDDRAVDVDPLRMAGGDGDLARPLAPEPAAAGATGHDRNRGGAASAALSPVSEPPVGAGG
jgi:hypothetical protein